MYQALLFDLDGTLVDSDPLHHRAFAHFLEPAGHTVDEAFFHERIHGRTVPEIFAELMPGEDPARLDAAKEEKFRTLLEDYDLPVTPGAAALLEAADAKGIPAAIATNGSHANAEAVLRRIGFTPRFKAVVSAEHCARGKPSPDPFLRAAERGGADPRRCRAFEDSGAGIASARAAGTTVVALTTVLSREAALAAGAHHVIDTFEAPELAELIA